MCTVQCTECAVHCLLLPMFNAVFCGTGGTDDLFAHLQNIDFCPQPFIYGHFYQPTHMNFKKVSGFFLLLWLLYRQERKINMKMQNVNICPRCSLFAPPASRWSGVLSSIKQLGWITHLLLMDQPPMLHAFQYLQPLCNRVHDM